MKGEGERNKNIKEKLKDKENKLGINKKKERNEMEDKI
jgi:hypothetical protein